MKLCFAHLALAAAVAILLSSCSDGNIYATLEREIVEEDLSLPNEIIVFDAVNVGGAGGSYYAAAGKIWTVPVATLDDPDPEKREWDVNAIVPAPALDEICTALAASPFGLAHTNTLYGGFINGSGNVGLFESSASPTTASATWTAVADVDVAGAQIALLKTDDDGSNDWLVAATAKLNTGTNRYNFSIVRSSDGDSFTDFPFDGSRPSGDEEKPINDLMYSTTAVAWFATEGGHLYWDQPSPGTLTRLTAIDAKLTAGEVLYGLFEYGGVIFVASWDDTDEAECAIYYSGDAGVSWERIAVPQADNGVYPPLTRFAGPLGTTALLVVGSDGYGYFVLDTGNLTVTDPYPLTRFATTTSDLYPAAVRKFFLDTAKSRLFACTALSGLWRGAVAGDGSIVWNQE
jgi:hypothetical protein